MDIKPNLVYRFVFASPFASLGYQTGIANTGFYRVLEIVPYERLLALDIDLMAELYTPAGLDDEDYQADMASYPGKIFYRLRSAVDPDTIITVPETVITQSPRSDVAQYGQVAIAIKLGIYADETALASLMQMIAQLVEYTQGQALDPSTDYQLMVFDNVWMLQEEYAQLEATREIVKTAATNVPVVDSEAGKPFNTWTEIARLQAERDALADQVAALTEIIESIES